MKRRKRMIILSAIIVLEVLNFFFLPIALLTFDDLFVTVSTFDMLVQSTYAVTPDLFLYASFSGIEVVSFLIFIVGVCFSFTKKQNLFVTILSALFIVISYVWSCCGESVCVNYINAEGGSYSFYSDIGLWILAVFYLAVMIFLSFDYAKKKERKE